MRLLEARQEVGQRGVAPAMAPEVHPQAVAESLGADVLGELLQDRRALAVGDAVEVQERDLRIGGGAGNGMSRGQLVGLVGPALDAVVEDLPGIAETRRA